MIRKELPALTEACDHALEKEADKQAPKKQTQEEAISTEAQKESYITCAKG